MPLLGALGQLNVFTEPPPPDPEEANYAGAFMLFAQSTAPVGWVKDSTYGNDQMLRVVGGTVSSGGSLDFSVAFGTRTATADTILATPGTSGTTTLTIPQIASHNHSYFGHSSYSRYVPSSGPASSALSSDTGSTGGGDGHNHTQSSSAASISPTIYNAYLPISIKYVDTIIASRGV